MYEYVDISQIDWKGTLPRFGIGNDFLTSKEGPCPICGGKSRFRFKDKGIGDWFCNACRGGNGVSLIAKVNDWTIARTFCELRGVGVANPNRHILQQVRPIPLDLTKLRVDLQSKWESAVAIQGTPAEAYLRRRIPGLDRGWLSGDLRFAELWYKDDDGKLRGKHPCLLSKIVDMDGRPISLHRTYLTQDGYKATSLGTVKKLMLGVRKLEGDAIRVNKPSSVSDTVICTEGIEKGAALVAWTKNQFEVWSLLNAGNLAKGKIPKRFKRVIIAGDRDPMDEKNGYRPGEHFASQLAGRLREEGFEVVIRIPEKEGVDFTDLWQEKFKLLKVA